MPKMTKNDTFLTPPKCQKMTKKWHFFDQKWVIFGPSFWRNYYRKRGFLPKIGVKMTLFLTKKWWKSGHFWTPQNDHVPKVLIFDILGTLWQNGSLAQTVLGAGRALMTPPRTPNDQKSQKCQKWPLFGKFPFVTDKNDILDHFYFCKKVMKKEWFFCKKRAIFDTLFRRKWPFFCSKCPK